MKRLILVMMLLSTASYAFPTQNLTATNNIDFIDGNFKGFYHKVAGKNDVSVQHDFTNNTGGLSLTNASAACRVSDLDGTIFIDVLPSSTTVTAVRVAFSISRTNIPPDGSYRMEIWAWQGAATNTARTIAQGGFDVYHSLYDDTNSFPFPNTTNDLTIYMETADYDSGDNNIVDTSDAFIAYTGSVSAVTNVTFSESTSNNAVKTGDQIVLMFNTNYPSVAEMTAVEGYTNYAYTAFSWGDHATNGYGLASAIATVSGRVDAVEGYTNAAQTAFGWGDHATNGYIDWTRYGGVNIFDRDGAWKAYYTNSLDAAFTAGQLAAYDIVTVGPGSYGFTGGELEFQENGVSLVGAGMGITTITNGQLEPVTNSVIAGITLDTMGSASASILIVDNVQVINCEIIEVRTIQANGTITIQLDGCHLVGTINNASGTLTVETSFSEYDPTDTAGGGSVVFDPQESESLRVSLDGIALNAVNHTNFPATVVETDSNNTFGANTTNNFTNGVTKGASPTADDHFATREYVDLGDIGGDLQFYLYNNNSADPSALLELVSTNDTSARQTNTIASVTNNQVIASYITRSGEPNLTEIEPGEIEWHFQAARSAGTKTVQLKWRLYAFDTSSNLVQIASDSETSDEITTDASDDIHIANASEVTIGLTDRLQADVVAVITGGGSAPSIDLYTKGTTANRIAVPVSAGNWVNVHGDTMRGNLLGGGNNLTGWGAIESDSLKLGAGATPTNIQTVLTETDTEIPTSDAVEDWVTAKSYTTVAATALLYQPTNANVTAYAADPLNLAFTNTTAKITGTTNRYWQVELYDAADATNFSIITFSGTNFIFKNNAGSNVVHLGIPSDT